MIFSLILASALAIGAFIWALGYESTYRYLSIRLKPFDDHKFVSHLLKIRLLVDSIFSKEWNKISRNAESIYSYLRDQEPNTARRYYSRTFQSTLIGDVRHNLLQPVSLKFIKHFKKIFRVPFKDLPLFINDRDGFTFLLVRWRLRHGI